MLSNRLYNLFHLIFVCGQKCGASKLGFDKKTLTFFVNRENSVAKNVKWTYRGLLLWNVLSFTTLVKFKLRTDLNSYKITLFFWLYLFGLSVQYSIIQLSPHKVCNFYGKYTKVIEIQNILILLIHNTYQNFFVTSRYHGKRFQSE